MKSLENIFGLSGRGFVVTGAAFDNTKTRNWAASATAIGCNGEPDDLCGITIFFASLASAYITGQTLHVDGGFTAR